MSNDKSDKLNDKSDDKLNDKSTDKSNNKWIYARIFYTYDINTPYWFFNMNVEYTPQEFMYYVSNSYIQYYQLEIYKKDNILWNVHGGLNDALETVFKNCEYEYLGESSSDKCIIYTFKYRSMK